MHCLRESVGGADGEMVQVVVEQEEVRGDCVSGYQDMSGFIEKGAEGREAGDRVCSDGGAARGCWRVAEDVVDDWGERKETGGHG